MSKSKFIFANAWESKRHVATFGQLLQEELSAWVIWNLVQSCKWKEKTSTNQQTCGSLPNGLSQIAFGDIDGADEAAGSCTWREKTTKSQKTGGNLPHVLSQIAIGGDVSPY